MSLMGTAVSGMLGDTSWLSNISQNVANANTTGSKNAETEFATVVDQVGAASSAGGGVTATLRSLNSLQGSVVGTSTTTDLAIKGAKGKRLTYQTTRGDRPAEIAPI